MRHWFSRLMKKLICVVNYDIIATFLHQTQCCIDNAGLFDGVGRVRPEHACVHDKPRARETRR